DEMTKNTKSRLKSERLTLWAGACNFVSGSVNAITSGLEFGANTSSAFSFLQNVGTKMSWGATGLGNAINGGYQAAACIKATQKCISATDAEAGEVYRLDAINQGIQATASLSIAGASTASVLGATVSIGSSPAVAPIVLIGLGAAAASFGANYY